MSVKQTQFAYDDEWAERKKKTGKTWKEIMELGIVSAEALAGVIFVGDKKVSPNEKPPSKEQREAIPPGPFEIIISSEKGKNREFDIYEDDMWQTMNAFSDVQEGDIFRIREIDEKNGADTVVKINNVRCFSYENLPYKNERKQLCALVVARAI
jgi:hypothetical protein